MYKSSFLASGHICPFKTSPHHKPERSVLTSPARTRHPPPAGRARCVKAQAPSKTTRGAPTVRRPPHSPPKPRGTGQDLVCAGRLGRLGRQRIDSIDVWF